MKHLNFGREMLSLFKQTQKRLNKAIELKLLNNPMSGHSKFTKVERRNRKLRNKYYMAGRIW